MKRTMMVAFLIFYLVSSVLAVVSIDAGTWLGAGLFAVMAFFFLWRSGVMYWRQERRWEPGGKP